MKVNYELVTATVDGTLLVTHKENYNKNKIMISNIKYILTLTRTQAHTLYRHHDRVLKPNSGMEQRYCLNHSMIYHGESFQYEFVEMQKTIVLNILMSSKIRTKRMSSRKVMSIR